MRAPKGGTVGVNGGWYAGGMYLPETEAEFTPRRGKRTKAERAELKAKQLDWLRKVESEAAAAFAR